MQVTITRAELLELWHGLPVLADLKGFKLGYAVARTKAKLRPVIGGFDKALKPDAAFQAFEEKRMKLCRKYAQKDPRGNFMSSSDSFVFGENQEAFDGEMAPLTAEFTEAIEARKRQIEDYNASLLESISVEVYQITEADVPDDVSVRQVEVLIRLIQD